MYVPRIVWNSLSTRYGLNLHNLVDAAKKHELVDAFMAKQRILVYISKSLLRSVQYGDHRSQKRFDAHKSTSSYAEARLDLSLMLRSVSEIPLYPQSNPNPTTTPHQSRYNSGATAKIAKFKKRRNRSNPTTEASFEDEASHQKMAKKVRVEYFLTEFELYQFCLFILDFYLFGKIKIRNYWDKFCV